MNGVVVNGWPYVIAAYVVTWVVVIGYTIRLVAMARRNRDMRSQLKNKS